MEKLMSDQYSVKFTHKEIYELVNLLDTCQDFSIRIDLRNKLHQVLIHNIMNVDNVRFICNMSRKFIDRHTNAICKLKLLHNPTKINLYISIPKKESFETHFGIYCDPDDKIYLSEFWTLVQSLQFNDGFFD